MQSLNRNLKDFKPKDYDYIIVDEAHHYKARTYEKVLKFFKPKFQLSLTATPFRNDGKAINDICGNIIYKSDINEAVDLNLLSEIEYIFVKDNLDFSKVKWNGQSYNKQDLNKKISIPKYDNAILEQYKQFEKKYSRKRTIAFCSTIEHAERMTRLFNKNNIKADFVISTLPRFQREQVIEDFSRGKLDIVFTVNIFNEGVDFPEVDMVLLLRPTMSDTIFQQQVGRGLRKSKDKDNVLILDFVGNSHNCHITSLEKLLKINIIQEVSKRYTSKDRNVIIVRQNFKIILSSSKIDILNKSYMNWTRDGAVIEYKKLKEKLDRKLTSKDFKTNKHGTISLTAIRGLFKTWNEFLTYMDGKKREKESYTLDWDKVDKDYIKHMKRLKRHPYVFKELQEDKSLSLPAETSFRRKFGSINKARDYYDKLVGKKYLRKYKGKYTTYRYDWAKVDKIYIKHMKRLNRHLISWGELTTNKFEGLPHRSTFIGKFGSIKRIRDYYDKLAGKKYERIINFRGRILKE